MHDMDVNEAKKKGLRALLGQMYEMIEEGDGDKEMDGDAVPSDLADDTAGSEGVSGEPDNEIDATRGEHGHEETAMGEDYCPMDGESGEMPSLKDQVRDYMKGNDRPKQGGEGSMTVTTVTASKGKPKGKSKPRGKRKAYA